LGREGLVSPLTAKLSAVRAENLVTRNRIEQRRLTEMRGSVEAQLAVQQAEVDRLQALVGLRRSQVSQLQVRPGIAGMLQQVPVEWASRWVPARTWRGWPTRSGSRRS